MMYRDDDIAQMSLAAIGGALVAESDGRLYARRDYGRVLEEIAGRVREVILCVGQVPERRIEEDYILPENVRLVPLPAAETAFRGLMSSRSIAGIYRKVIGQADAVFVRGVLNPAISVIYKECQRHNKPVCHWLVGNPMALLNSHRRDSVMKDALGKGFVWWWERQLHCGHAGSRSAYLCNGQEIANRHPSNRKHVVVSTTLTDDDLYYREDTCYNDPVRVLSLGFIRPEKGIEYLLEAISCLRTSRSVELVLVGGRTRYPAYQAKLDRLVEEYDIVDRVKWVGHQDYLGVVRYMRESDIFAFPSLSEGTPRVLVEARAASLPVVSTNVGGIPDSVEDGFDGILVPPKDPQAMAEGIDRIIEDGSLRRRIIANGYARAGGMTVHRFVDRIVEVIQQL